jgi:hypothetical protein
VRNDGYKNPYQLRVRPATGASGLVTYLLGVSGGFVLRERNDWMQCVRVMCHGRYG